MALNKDGIEGGSVVDHYAMMNVNNERRTQKIEAERAAKKAVKKPVKKPVKKAE